MSRARGRMVLHRDASCSPFFFQAEDGIRDVAVTGVQTLCSSDLLKQRAETVVRSSVTGTVQSFPLRPGDLVAPNQTVAEILEESQLWVRVYVPETQLGLIRVDQPVRVRDRTSTRLNSSR